MAVHTGMTPSSVRSTERSEALFERAKVLMPGGVSSPVRAFRSVGGTPRFLARAAGPHSLGLEHFDHTQFDGFYQPFVIEENCVLNVDMPLLIYGRDAMHLEDTIVIRKNGIEYLTSNQTGMVEIAV